MRAATITSRQAKSLAVDLIKRWGEPAIRDGISGAIFDYCEQSAKGHGFEWNAEAVCMIEDQVRGLANEAVRVYDGPEPPAVNLIGRVLSGELSAADVLIETRVVEKMLDDMHCLQAVAAVRRPLHYVITGQERELGTYYRFNKSTLMVVLTLLIGFDGLMSGIGGFYSEESARAKKGQWKPREVWIEAW